MKEIIQYSITIIAAIIVNILILKFIDNTIAWEILMVIDIAVCVATYKIQKMVNSDNNKGNSRK